MVKVKKDIVINGVTYKDIQLSQWSGDSYNIDTAGIATVIRQFIKNNYGDIKVWARSKSFAGGSSVDIYLWNVPIEWYNKIESFADSFGMYNEYDGGDGYWRGKSIGASLPDGTLVGNYSPYMHVSNTPPWDAKEKDMTPPDYSKSQKKSFPKKGGFPKKESKTADFTLIHDCGNGWKVFEKYNENEPKPYTYRVVKDYDTKPVGKDDFYALKGKMLDEGFLWAIKVQCFERNNVLQLSNFDFVCAVLSDYFPMKEQPKTEPTNDFEDIIPTETTKEVSLEQLLNDMAILLDLEEDSVKRAELQQYIEDLQVLASLNN